MPYSVKGFFEIDEDMIQDYFEEVRQQDLIFPSIGVEELLILVLEAQSQLRPFYFVVRSRRIVNIALYSIDFWHVQISRRKTSFRHAHSKPQQHAECFDHVRRTSFTRRGTGFYPHRVNSKWPTMRRKKQLMIKGTWFQWYVQY